MVTSAGLIYIDNLPNLVYYFDSQCYGYSHEKNMLINTFCFAGFESTFTPNNFPESS